MLELLWPLAAVCIILILAYLVTRYAVGRLGRGIRPRRGSLTVLEQIPLGREQKLLLVEIGENVYLLGVTPGSITRLEKLPKEAIARQDREYGGQSGDERGMEFRKALEKVLEQRKKQGRP